MVAHDILELHFIHEVRDGILSLAVVFGKGHNFNSHWLPGLSVFVEMQRTHH